MNGDKTQNRLTWLPMSMDELRATGADAPDFVLVTGDAYVDHPSFGAAIIGRVLQREGFSVGIIAQPDWHGTDDFMRFGRPKLAFLVTSGNIDSMVNHYTAAKKPRSSDAYSEDGLAGRRPDRAATVYANRIKQAYRRVPVILGGIEASLRRFAHYDYWSDGVKNSVLIDSGVDMLVYGMGERAICEAASRLAAGTPIDALDDIRGTCVLKTAQTLPDCIILPSVEEVSNDKRRYAEAFAIQQREQDPVRGRALAQRHGKNYVLQNPPAMPLSQRELDAVYGLPYTRSPHPDYSGHIPAADEVRFSLTSCRGCFGNCSFCALTMHQGRMISARSHESLITEARLLTRLSDFKGYIHDVGGPTANFRRDACSKQRTHGSCADKSCLGYSPCSNVEPDHSDYLALLRKLRELDGVKKVFVRSGVRYDYVMYDKSDAFLRELIKHHVSGQLKVAPEHVCDRVLKLMDKPPAELYDRFVHKYAALNRSLGLQQYIVPYFMSSHPGSDLSAAIELALYLKRHELHVEQVQDFYPTPGTASTCMYFTGLDPRTMREVFVPRSPREKAMQRALMQYYVPANRALVRDALKEAGREDLIGFDKSALVPPYVRKPSAGSRSGKKAGGSAVGRSGDRNRGRPARRSRGRT
ncbi:MAG: YgiQ family radical SAM protein [Clostridia bacterium]|nr:YgiQ family radical SAM protein [Clostridia bacterium]